MFLKSHNQVSLLSKKLKDAGIIEAGARRPFDELLYFKLNDGQFELLNTVFLLKKQNNLNTIL